MGGPGSGRLFHFDRQTSLEECLWIDVCDWKRRGLLLPGMGFSCKGSGVIGRAAEALVAAAGGPGRTHFGA
jgi:hypothetical protein